MYQSLPRQDFPEEYLLGLSDNEHLRVVEMGISLFGPIRVALWGDPQFLETNPLAIIRPSVYVRKTARGKGVCVGIEGVVREQM